MAGQRLPLVARARHCASILQGEVEVLGDRAPLWARSHENLDGFDHVDPLILPVFGYAYSGVYFPSPNGIGQWHALVSCVHFYLDPIRRCHFAQGELAALVHLHRQSPCGPAAGLPLPWQFLTLSPWYLIPHGRLALRAAIH